MIERFRDHAANERTYLAWVRTAVTVMGFGLLVERLGGGSAAADPPPRRSTRSPKPITVTAVRTQAR